jgi:dihydroflavonol-4-reductase
MKPTVMVLGATGFIGAHVARKLDRQGFSVHATRRASSRTDHIDDVDIDWHSVDLDRDGELAEALGPCQALFDCAGYYPKDGLRVERARRRGVGRVRRVMDACKQSGIGRVVYVSSPATMGLEGDDQGRVSESDLYVPGTVDDAYFEAKFSMEAEVYRYVDDGLPVVIALPTAVFGPGDIKPTTGEFVVRVADGRMPVLVDGRFNAVDVRDLADTLVAALQQGRPGRRYVIGGANVGIEDFTRMVTDIRGVEPPSYTLPGKWTREAARIAERLGRKVGYDGPSPLVAVDLIHFARPVESERSEGELHHSTRPLEATVRDTVEWFATHGYLR